MELLVSIITLYSKIDTFQNVWGGKISVVAPSRDCWPLLVPWILHHWDCCSFENWKDRNIPICCWLLVPSAWSMILIIDHTGSYSWLALNHIKVNNLENYLYYIELIAMGITWICSYLLLLILFLSSFATSRSIVKTLPGFDGDLPFKLETGLVNLIIHFYNFYLVTFIC